MVGDKLSSDGGKADVDVDDREQLLEKETPLPPKEEPQYTVWMRIVAALAYGVSSFGTVVVMKVVLTAYSFPSPVVFAWLQCAATSSLLGGLCILGRVKIARPTSKLVRGVLPVAALFVLNVTTSLLGTKSISLPMFTVLRRFTIPMTMVMEAYFEGKQPSGIVKLSESLMVLGAVIAAGSDLAFDLAGYCMIFLSDLGTTGYVVAIRTSLKHMELSKTTLLFYNSILGFCALSTVLFYQLSASPQNGSLVESIDFKGWGDPYFCLMATFAMLAGAVLNYSSFLCVQVNSGLTTNVIGCLKNVVTSYLGIIVGGDYVFSWSNFAGLNVSICGSVIYSYDNFRKK